MVKPIEIGVALLAGVAAGWFAAAAPSTTTARPAAPDAAPAAPPSPARAADADPCPIPALRAEAARLGAEQVARAVGAATAAATPDAPPPPPTPWPAELPAAYAPAAYEATVRAVAGDLDVLAVDCDEYPCLVTVAAAPDAWADLVQRLDAAGLSSGQLFAQPDGDRVTFGHLGDEDRSSDAWRRAEARAAAR